MMKTDMIKHDVVLFCYFVLSEQICPGSTPALFMRIKSAFWYSKCAFNAHKKRWCATWVDDNDGG